MAINRLCSRRDTYATMLGRLWGLYAPLEAALAHIDWGNAAVDFPARRKAAWLADDLAALGVTVNERLRLPQATQLPSLAGVAEGMGTLYVLEGASLGGQIISRRLKTDLGVSERAGGRFFASYGPEVGERWRAYLVALEAVATSPATEERIERAALETFACFLSWMPPPVQATGDLLENPDAG